MTKFIKYLWMLAKLRQLEYVKNKLIAKKHDIRKDILEATKKYEEQLSKVKENINKVQ